MAAMESQASAEEEEGTGTTEGARAALVGSPDNNNVTSSRPGAVSSSDRSPTTGSNCSRRSGLQRSQEERQAKRMSLSGAKPKPVSSSDRTATASSSCSNRSGLQRSLEDVQAKRMSLPGPNVSPRKSLTKQDTTRPISLVPAGRGLSNPKKKKKLDTNAPSPTTQSSITLVNMGILSGNQRPSITRRGLSKNSRPEGEVGHASDRGFQLNPSLALPFWRNQEAMAQDMASQWQRAERSAGGSGLEEPEITLPGGDAAEALLLLPPLGLSMQQHLLGEPEMSVPGQWETPPNGYILGDADESEPSIAFPPAGDQNQPDELVEAREVTEEESNLELAEAKEVDPAVLEKQEHDKAKARECRRIGYCIILFSVAIIIGSVFAARAKEGPKTILQPSMAPSLLPSQAPSVAPSRILEDFLDGLPSETSLHVNIPNSPQMLAYNRLLNHPRLTSLPHWKRVQFFAVTTLFYAMQGLHWPQPLRDSWMDSAKDECYWFSGNFGVLWTDGTWEQFPLDHPLRRETCNQFGEIEVLHISDLFLSEHLAHVPPEITLLTSLNSLKFEWIEFNQSLSDLIPTQELVSMTTLAELSLFLNPGLECTIPSQVGLLSKLTHLRLALGDFSGSIPTEIGMLSNLVDLSFAGGLLSGTIPSQLGRLTNLGTLFLNSNQLSGSIPIKFGSLSGLHRLHLDHNELLGTITSETGLLTNLEELWLRNNDLQGTIPTELCLLTNATGFYMSSNDLTGWLPTELALLTSLELLELSNNGFTGPIPSEIGVLASLEILDLATNDLSGNLPALPSLSGLLLWNISNNGPLSGTIPEELCAIGENTSCFYGPWGDLPCAISFDCGGLLCGCNDCTCL